MIEINSIKSVRLRKIFRRAIKKPNFSIKFRDTRCPDLLCDLIDSRRNYEDRLNYANPFKEDYTVVSMWTSMNKNDKKSIAFQELLYQYLYSQIYIKYAVI